MTTPKPTDEEVADYAKRLATAWSKAAMRPISTHCSIGQDGTVVQHLAPTVRRGDDSRIKGAHFDLVIIDELEDIEFVP